MKLHSLDLPESNSEQVVWLESYLVGTHLSALVAELRAIHQSRSQQSLECLLGDQQDEVLEYGLKRISEDQLSGLLQNPNSLFELQERVMLYGSAYWQSVSPVETDAKRHSGVDFGAIVQAAGIDATSTDQTVSVESALPRREWYSHPLVVCVATAAAVMLCTNLLPRENDTITQVSPSGPPSFDPSAPPDRLVPPERPLQIADSNWGWMRKDELAVEKPRAAYLNELADKATEWFSKRPENTNDTAARIAEFRQGCSRLILAEHEPLGKSDRAWLLKKCRSWAATFDAELIALESGEPNEEVLNKMDNTTRLLVAALRSRAERDVG